MRTEPPPGYHRRRIFSLSLGDWLDNEVPIEWLAEMLDTIRQCDQVTWILCTKRPENFRTQLEDVCRFIEDKGVCTSAEDATWIWVLDWMTGEKVPPHIILLTSVENQPMLDKRYSDSVAIPAACRGFSFEPLLSEIIVPDWTGISWAIIGGESGTSSRPCNVDWIRSLVEQGKAAGIATFVKQLGAVPIIAPCRQNHFDWKYKTANSERPDDKMFSELLHENKTMWRVLLTDKKGGDVNEFPDGSRLRIQQWPKGF